MISSDPLAADTTTAAPPPPPSFSPSTAAITAASAVRDHANLDSGGTPPSPGPPTPGSMPAAITPIRRSSTEPPLLGPAAPVATVDRARKDADYPDGAPPKRRTSSLGADSTHRKPSSVHMDTQSGSAGGGPGASSLRSTSATGPLATYMVEFNNPRLAMTLARELMYPTNYIRTTKYTLLSFLPMNLFGQFRRLSNLYFLLGAVFSLVGDSAISPFAQVAPLVFVLTITAIKDGLEDYSRYKADVAANNAPCVVVKSQLHVSTKSRDLVPGDIVFLKKGDKVPADLVLLSTSYSDGNCFIETSELDGETSLKRRNALHETMHATTPEQIGEIAGQIQCELPNENLSKFEGRLLLSHPPGTGGANSDRVHPLTMNQLILRGSFLRNTDFCYGVVVYAGVETKIFKNLKQSGLKFSSMEKTLNWIVLTAFCYNVIILLVSVILSQQSAVSLHWYLLDPRPPTGTVDTGLGWFGPFMTFFVLYSYTIPVSLFVIIEGVRIVQRQLMVWDDAMKCPKGHGMRVNNSNLNEDLGSIDYVFSDKTGTLTRNEMVLTKLCIGNRVLGTRSLRKFDQDPVTREFVRCVLVCNSAIPVEDEAALPSAPPPSGGPGSAASSKEEEVRRGPGLKYESQSPDEIALLNGVRALGVFKMRKKSSLLVEEQGTDLTLTVLDSIEFNSDRKRMSVVIRDENGRIRVYTKGADNVMLPRVDPAQTDLISGTVDQLRLFSEEGLRTLVFAAKDLTEDAYSEFKRKYDDAARSLVDREMRMERAAALIERDGYELLGCSAIEDRLQDKVPETIECLLRCGIRVWLLTGDKQETAVNIGLSCQLINAQMTILKLTATTADKVVEEIAHHETVAASLAPHQLALVVTGDTLALILESCPRALVDLGTRCSSVICCRVTPLQKALVVRLCKTELKVTTLSIGDGANDVSMIQEADIGVGIEGMEGAQAVRAADYAFVEFKSLARLVTVHGRYSLLRLSNLVFYSFYKNVSFITTQFLFGALNMWSGSCMYNGTFLPNWNVLYTSLPPFLYGFLEKDVPEQQLLANPPLYHTGRSKNFWSWRRMAQWTASAIWHTTVAWYSIYIVFMDSPALLSNGFTADMDLFQWFNAAIILGTVSLKMVAMTTHWTRPTVYGLLASYLLFSATLGGLEILTQLDINLRGHMATDDLPLETDMWLHTTPAYWLGVFGAPLAAVLPDMIARYWQVQEAPTDVDVLRELHVVHGHRPESLSNATTTTATSTGGDTITTITVAGGPVLPERRRSSTFKRARQGSVTGEGVVATGYTTRRLSAPAAGVAIGIPMHAHSGSTAATASGNHVVLVEGSTATALNVPAGAPPGLGPAPSSASNVSNRSATAMGSSGLGLSASVNGGGGSSSRNAPPPPTPPTSSPTSATGLFQSAAAVALMAGSSGTGGNRAIKGAPPPQIAE
ncbi:phospholipid-translocating P-type ATPase, flippase [Allomyces macrogynus ATCC 38327]|uniref:Phospholipid-transporting ATPase n=1 Tax=Allomyces macrogynus (strain ATCC 38327) TaxID=578462 RepID=A0A0L0SGI5_ALLM3|nr:phospholipid-translocating P-type ATPase, flippase [Allomyces macrogynus ATCC 38327]|eukprot:KNE61628.1 phospholipid-translocating P-type ATPase, flippase [Allomyces macrogynus ATCC 38327]